MVVLGGGAFSHEQSTPVQQGQSYEHRTTLHELPARGKACIHIHTDKSGWSPGKVPPRDQDGPTSGPEVLGLDPLPGAIAGETRASLSEAGLSQY